MVAKVKTLRDVVEAVQRRQIESLDVQPVECGDEQIDIIALLIFEARKSLVANQPVNVLSALNVAMDVVSKLQEDVRKAKGIAGLGGNDMNKQNPTIGQG